MHYLATFAERPPAELSYQLQLEAMNNSVPFG